MVRKISASGISAYGTSYSDGSESDSSRSHSPVPQGDYTSLIDKMKKYAESGDIFFSLEFFPPRTKNGAANLLSQFDRMKAGGPLFCDITWHAAGCPGGDSETSSMTIAGAALNYCGLDTVLHMTCCSATREQITNHLRRARDNGIKSILALRGDAPNIEGWKFPEDGLSHAVDLVRHIRELFGDYFVIGVAGYPSGHPESASYESDLHYLKEKVDAGADFVICQLCFTAETFLSYVQDCRRIGINVPIIPGVMPIQSYDSVRQIAKLSKLDIPEEILTVLQPIQGNDEAIRKFGIDQCVQLCRTLLSSGEVPGIHFYTLNREKATTTILKQVGLWNQSPLKPLPWPVAVNHKRCSEDVRPIFWSSRPRSYIYRTQTWDEFPNGRWGHSESPAFGELRDYHLFFMLSRSPKEELLNMWGRKLSSEQDIWDIFHCYVSGSPNKEGVMVTKLPWHDDELRQETAEITDNLSSVNKRGILTINSQPNVNGAPSNHPVYGWGRPGGYVYQKAYIEFFTCKKNVEALKVVLKNYPQVNYHIIDSSGREDYTNCHKQRPIAVTWGVFPGLEIIQPTVVDPISFKVWKDEAFSLWQDPWANLYPEDCTSRTVLAKIMQDYCLVNLVDNNYPENSCLWQLLEDVINFDQGQLQCS